MFSRDAAREGPMVLAVFLVETASSTNTFAGAKYLRSAQGGQ